MRVVVSGDRRWYEADAIWRPLDELYAEYHEDLVLIEGCAHGADELAGYHEPGRHMGHDFPGGWAWRRSLPESQYRHVPADWRGQGLKAGPIRNEAMLSRNPDLVLAFHHNLAESKGTAHMVRIAKAAGVEVRLIG